LGALASNTHGDDNTAAGVSALQSNTMGNDNTAYGLDALFSNIDGINNTAVGVFALGGQQHGDNNTAIGVSALAVNTTGDGNTANGYQALFHNTTDTANFNTAVGYQALLNLTTGAGNTALGVLAGTGLGTATNVICIGATGADVNNSCFINNIWQQAGGSRAVFVNASGKLGAMVSSRRFKDEIKSMEEASEVIYRLKPVSFRYKPEIEPTRPLGFGLIAETWKRLIPTWWLATRKENRTVCATTR
jgi:trimeric autotransporter adhesin